MRQRAAGRIQTIWSRVIGRSWLRSITGPGRTTRRRAASRGSETSTSRRLPRRGPMLTVAVLALGALLLSSCDWPMWGNGAGNSRSSLDTGISTANVASLKLKFTATVTAVPAGCSINYAESPVILNGVGYFEFSLFPTNPFVAPCSASGGGGLAAFNTTTGAILWTQITAGSDFASPALDNGMVYDAVGGLYAFNASTGALVWHDANVGTDGSPTVANGIVYVTDLHGDVNAINDTTGALVWTAQASGGAGPAPAVGPNGIVYVGPNTGGSLDAFNATTGALVWSAPAGFAATPSYVSPVVVNGTVFVAISSVEAFNAATGAAAWTTPIGNLSGVGIAVANGTVYLGDAYDGNMKAFDATTGTVVWSTTTATSGFLDPPAVANGIVYIASHASNSTGTSSTLYAFDATTGTVLWSAPAGTADSPPSANGPARYGQPGPVIAEGVVYVGSADGNVYAFGLP